jgi:hypothetical protein
MQVGLKFAVFSAKAFLRMRATSAEAATASWLIPDGAT